VPRVLALSTTVEFRRRFMNGPNSLLFTLMRPRKWLRLWALSTPVLVSSKDIFYFLRRPHTGLKRAVRKVSY
jgi:hypothetical protein